MHFDEVCLRQTFYFSANKNKFFSPHPLQQVHEIRAFLNSLPSSSVVFHFFLLLLSGREGLGLGARAVWAFRCTWGYQSGTVCLLLLTLTSSGFWGLGILPLLLSFLPSMGFLQRNHLYFTAQIKRQKEIRDWGILFRHFFQMRWIFTKSLKKGIPKCMRLFGEHHRKEEGSTL